MSSQYLLTYEETTRGTAPGSPTYLTLPITGALQPTFTPTDEPRKEFRGNDTALGDIASVRKSSQWSYTLECAWYPDSPAIGLLFKHLFGGEGTRSVVDTSGYAGNIYPIASPYGSGAEPLADKAIAICSHTDEDGTTKQQVFGGGRVKSCTITISGTDDIKLSFEIVGPGEYVGTPDQALTAIGTLPSVDPFCSSDVTCWASTGISRTGTTPNFTDIEEGTMDSFTPDSVTITITNGLDDKVVMNGVKGPSQTSRTAQFMAEISMPMDYEDPATGFSSADEFKTLFTGVRTNALGFEITSSTLAGAASEYYRAFIDVAAVLVKAETPTRNSDGVTPSIPFTCSTLYDSTAEYPISIFVVDQDAAY